MIIILWHNRSTVHFVLVIVGEDIVLFCVNDSLHNVTCMVTLGLKYGADYVHNLWTDCGASHENTLDDSACDLLKLSIYILNQFKGWFT